MKNSNDTIGNRTRDLLACSAVPQPTGPLCDPYCEVGTLFYVDDRQVPNACYPVQKPSVQKQHRFIYTVPHFILLVYVVSKPNILQ